MDFASLPDTAPAGYASTGDSLSLPQADTSGARHNQRLEQQYRAAGGEAMPQQYGVFFHQVVADPAKSEKYGRPCHRTEVYVKIKSPGVTDFVSRKATDEHIRQFSESWAAFQQMVGATEEGRDLAKCLPSVDAAVWEDLKAIKRPYIDQLTEDIPGLENVCDDARMYLRLKKPRMKFVNGKLEEVK